MKFLAILLSILLTTLTMSRATGHPAIVSPVDIVLPKGMSPTCLMPRPQLMAQQGNPGHHEPPPGWHCAHGAGDDKKEPCTCHRECIDVNGEDENGTQLPTHTEVKEDAKCSSFCYKDHCQCGVHNCD